VLTTSAASPVLMAHAAPEDPTGTATRAEAAPQKNAAVCLLLKLTF